MKIKPARQLLFLGLILPYLVFIVLLVTSDNFQKFELTDILVFMAIVFIIPHLLIYFNYLREDFGKRIRFENDRIFLRKGETASEIEIIKNQIDQVTVTTAKWIGTGWQLFDFVTLEMTNGKRYHITSLTSSMSKILKMIDLPNRVKFKTKIIPIVK